MTEFSISRAGGFAAVAGAEIRLSGGLFYIHGKPSGKG